MRREQRLQRRSDFDAVFRKGQRISRGVLALRVLERGDDAPGRFGFAISSRLGGAVVRNRIRRRLRESARRIDARGLDVVVIARTGAAQASFQELDRTLTQLLRRLHERPPRRRSPREDGRS